MGALSSSTAFSSVLHDWMFRRWNGLCAVYAPETSLHYQVVNIFSTSVGICNNFIWNAFLNFKVWNHFFLRFCSFYCVGAIGILITSGCLYLLIECLDWNKIAAKVITIFLVTAVQFLLNKYTTFKKKSY